MCDELAKAKINITALTISDTIDHSVIRMIVSETRKALLLLEEHNVLVVESEVLIIKGDNKAGSLSEIAKKLSSAKINIEYAYLATPPDARKGIMVLRPNNIQKALKVLSA